MPISGSRAAPSGWRRSPRPPTASPSCSGRQAAASPACCRRLLDCQAADPATIRLAGRDLDDRMLRRTERGLGLVFQDARLFPASDARAGTSPTPGTRAARLAPAVDDAGASSTSPPCWTGRSAIFPAARKAGSRWPRALAPRRTSCCWTNPSRRWTAARRRAFIQVLLQMHRTLRLPMLVVTHDIDDAAALASNLVALEGGRCGRARPVPAASGMPALRGPVGCARQRRSGAQPVAAQQPR